MGILTIIIKGRSPQNIYALTDEKFFWEPISFIAMDTKITMFPITCTEWWTKARGDVGHGSCVRDNCV